MRPLTRHGFAQRPAFGHRHTKGARKGIAGGESRICGVMVESHLVAGAQKFSAGKDDPAALEYGKSITDACLGWGDSLEVLEILHGAVKTRRAHAG